MSDFFDGMFQPARTSPVLISPELAVKIGIMSGGNAMLQARATLGSDRFSIYCSKCGDRKIIPSVDFTPTDIPADVTQFCNFHKHDLKFLSVKTQDTGRKFKEDA